MSAGYQAFHIKMNRVESNFFITTFNTDKCPNTSEKNVQKIILLVHEYQNVRKMEMKYEVYLVIWKKEIRNFYLLDTILPTV